MNDRGEKLIYSLLIVVLSHQFILFAFPDKRAGLWFAAKQRTDDQKTFVALKKLSATN